jgi:hypothetical protein
VLVKLLVTVASTAILLLHTRLIRYAAHAALDGAFSVADLGRLRLVRTISAHCSLILLMVPACTDHSPPARHR